MNEFELNGAELNGSVGAGNPGAGNIGALVIPTRVHVRDPNRLYIPTKVEVLPGNNGSLSIPTKVQVSGRGSLVVPTTVVVTDSLNTIKWTAKVMIGGVNWSANLVETLSVDAEEGSSRVATFTLRPPAGPIDPTQWTALPVTIDMGRVVNGQTYYSRLFVGTVEYAQYDPNTRLFEINCTDDLQLTVAKMTRANIDALTGAQYHEAVMGEIEDNWDYAESLMTTREGSLDKSRFGGVRVCPWFNLSTWRTFGTDDLWDVSLDAEIARRSDLVNKVTIDVGYRFAKLRERGDAVGWSGPPVYSINAEYMGFAYPSISDIMGALRGTGWWIHQATIFPAGLISCGTQFASKTINNTLMYIDIGAGASVAMFAKLGHRFAQTVTENMTITVTAPQSVTRNGEIPQEFTVSADSDADVSDWENFEAPLYDDQGQEIDMTPPGFIGLVERNYDPIVSRSSYEDAQLIAIAKAKTMIRASHRKSVVRASMPCLPELDLEMKVGVNTATVVASGKVAQIVHTLDIEAGEADTEFRLAISGIGAVGNANPSPLVPQDEIPSALPTHTWVSHHHGTYIPHNNPGYSENMRGWVVTPPSSVSAFELDNCVRSNGTSIPTPFAGGSYPSSGFKVEMPGVDDEYRNEEVREATASYTVDIPIDPLTLIV